jgi:hypothetical protein
MNLRGSSVYLGTTLFLGLTLAGMFLHASCAVHASAPGFTRKRELVRRAGLTDLCLFTEAGYTRHLSMTDHAAPFQDAPASFEHFPSGALAGPPPFLQPNHEHQH